MDTNRIQQYVLEIWHWLVEGKYGFIFILVLGAAWFFGFYILCSENSIRIAGYFLQFFGMMVTIRGLLRIRKYFEHDPLWELFKNWLKRFPRWKVEGRRISADWAIPFSIVKGYGGPWNEDDPCQRLEVRIKRIIENMNIIKEVQSRHTIFIDDLRDSQKEHKKEVAIKVKEMEERFNSDLESLHTSDLIPYLVGLFWLIIGITMSTMAPELYQLFK